MKSIVHEKKGILNPNNRVILFGINFIFLQIISGVIREKRVVEFMWGIYCFLRYRPKKCLIYEEKLQEVKFSKFKVLGVNDEKIISRSWIYNNDSIIYVEYGQPGARIIFKNKEVLKIYDPYRDDKRIYHIHNIVKISENIYLISTGDSSKYLDEFLINKYECKFLKRHLKYLGGFTASIEINSEILMGTDFSCRPNYLFNITSGEKYFLPKKAWLEYILDIEKIAKNCIEITTKRLSDGTGHKLIFDLNSKSFIYVAKVRIMEEISYETL